MDIICSICQCSIGIDPPPGSTELGDLFDSVAPSYGHSTQEHWETGSKVVTTPCGHLFHNSCLTQWFVMIGNRRCPLCNFVSPVHKILSIYPCVTPASASVEQLNMSGSAASSSVSVSLNKMDTVAESSHDNMNSLACGSDPGDESLEVSPPCEILDLQATETTISGIRTMVYHFGPMRNLPFETRDSVPSMKSHRLRSMSKTWTLPTTSCSKCNNLARIQALMTSDMQDLRDLVAEQKSEIDSLRTIVECFKRGQEMVPNF